MMKIILLNIERVNRKEEIMRKILDIITSEFEQAFEPLLEKAYDGMEKIEPKKTGEKCPECGGDLVIRKGRFGEFVACSNYPECKYIKNSRKKAEPVMTDEVCPNCGSPVVIKKGRWGEFKACSNYPKCHYIKKEPKKTEEDK